jgi:phosphoserine phosphatase RsbU/P
LSTFSDTTKRDWGLAIAGVLAAMLFAWFMLEDHPLRLADSSLGAGNAAERASGLLDELGFQPDDSPRPELKVDSVLLDSLQAQTDFKSFLGRDDYRQLYPVFYWNNRFLFGEWDPTDVFMESDGVSQLDVRLNENGYLLALENHDRLIPDGVFHEQVLLYSTELDAERLGQFPRDSTVFGLIHFSFGENQAGLMNDFETRVYLHRDAAFRMGEYYMEQSAWAGAEIISESVEKVTFGDVEAARVTYALASGPIHQQPRLELTVLPTGALTAMEYHFEEPPAPPMSLETIKSGIKIGIVMLAVFWVLALLIIRFKMRLIDMRAAILIAVLAGFIFPFIIMLNQLHGFFSAGGELNMRFLLMLLFSSGVMAAFASILFFLSTSISDSITRQYWPGKLRTIDLMRTGHFLNRPIGLSLVRSVSYSLILAALIVLLTNLIPGSYFSVNESFASNGVYLSNLVMVLSNLLFVLLFTQAIFLIGLGQIRSLTGRPVVLILIVGVTFALINPASFQIGPASAEMIITGVIGLAVGWIYLRDDYLTIFLTLFFVMGHLETAPGWLIPHSPDLSLFYTHLFLLAGVVVLGVYAIRKGKTVSELPDFVPEYIEELAQDERIKQELQIARKVQESFLPDQTPDFPGLDIAAICKPAYETGGDYYDFIEIDDDKLAMAIGDVSGKGIQAAFYMTFTKGVLHAICQQFVSTIDVLAKCNKLFRKNARRGTFVSLIFGVVDMNRQEFTFSRAGHNPLLYFNSQTRKLHVFTPQGIGLGMTEEEIFRKSLTEQSIRLQKDDILVMFTDGIVEATNERKRFYGDDRLRNLIEAYHEMSAEKLLQKIMEDLDRFGGNLNPHDDMTMLIIKKK